MAIDLKGRRTALAELTQKANALYADLEAKGAAATQEDRNVLFQLIEDGQKARDDLTRLEQLEGLDQHVNQPAGDRKVQDRGDSRPVRKSWGQIVASSPALDTKQLGPRDIRGWDVSAWDRKALSEGDLSAGGALLIPQYATDVISLVPQRPKSVITLIAVQQTSAEAFTYFVMTSRTNSAGVIAELGTYQESDLVFDKATAVVKKIGTWVKASEEVLDDVPRLRAIVDGELVYMVEIKLEDQVVAGDGVGDNFLGIINTPGIQTRTHQVSGRDWDVNDKPADTIRRALTDLTLAFYRPDGIVLNPIQSEELELTKSTLGTYIMIYDPVQMRLWRQPVVETQAMPAGTALVGAYRIGATLWDRQQTQVLVGQPDDFFLTDGVAVKARLRAAFGVQRPQAFEKVDGL